MSALMLQTRNAKMTSITTRPSFQKIYKVQKLLSFGQSSPVSAQQSWKSFFATRRFHPVTLTVQVKHSYRVNHSAIQLTRNVGKSLTRQALSCLTVILFTQEVTVQTAFVKSQNGQSLGPRNSGQHHIVSKTASINMHNLSPGDKIQCSCINAIGFSILSS